MLKFMAKTMVESDVIPDVPGLSLGGDEEIRLSDNGK
jgi:hypothetical protein